MTTSKLTFKIIKIFKYFIFILLVGKLSHATVDDVDWTSLDLKWRRPLCIKESVYPIDSQRAAGYFNEIEDKLKSSYGVSQVSKLLYQSSQLSPEIMDQFRELLIYKALEVGRSKNKKMNTNEIRNFAKSSYDICSRILNKYPATRCHDFLLVTIKPEDFINLVSNHFVLYQSSAIYLLDMQNQCRGIEYPDWNCNELAKEYFSKNHLDSCLAGHFEPPEKILPTPLTE